MSKQWFAAYRAYGITALNTNGPRADKLIVFDGKAERDAWVAGDIHHREAVVAGANEVRAARRFEAREGYAVIRTAADWRE